jgi:hypothetical protein
MTEDNWINKAIDETKKSNAFIEADFISELEEIIKSEFTEGKLTSAELKNVSEKLISNMEIDSHLDGTHENSYNRIVMVSWRGRVYCIRYKG